MKALAKCWMAKLWNERKIKMITRKNRTTKIRGTLPEICTDLTVIIREFRKCLSKHLPEEEIEKLIADAVSLSKKTGNELDQEAIERILKRLEEDADA